MNNYNWGKFTKRINIQVIISSVYAAIATQEGIEKWFLRLAAFTTPAGLPRDRHTFVEKGDTYLWRWHGYGDEATQRGNITAANGSDYLQFDFDIEQVTEGMVVGISIYTEGDSTIVELMQDNIPTDDKSRSSIHIGCMTGWIFYLTNLKSILEGGIDLRNKNEQIQRVINA